MNHRILSIQPRSWNQGFVLFVALFCASMIGSATASAVSVSLSFNPSGMLRGSNTVLIASTSGGTAPYTFTYQTRPAGTSTWSSSSLAGATNTYAWPLSMQARARVVDGTSATSAWSAAASLIVTQPVVTVAFNPAVVTQSQFSVASASVRSATDPVTYQWQKKVGSVWTNVSGSEATITNVWAATVQYRARSLDANSVTSEWSAAATLTVMPSAISATLAFDPSNVVRGLPSVLTATPTNGTAPYTYRYEYRYGGTGSWSAVPGMTAAVKTNAWRSTVEFRVRAVDSFSSTSAWASALLTVLQPAVTVAFDPAVVTQGEFSVASASATNATAPVTYQWQKKVGSVWTNVAGSDPQITNAWAATVEYRARSVDANSITSDWSAAATLTVMPSALSASLAFDPSSVVRGLSSVLTAAATNGTAPYTYSYEYRYGGAGSWSAVPGMTAPMKTNAWRSSVEFRVRAVDSFSATSAWASASLTVLQPAVAVAFDPAVVTQSQFSVVSASVTNATDPVTYQWQQNTGSGWTDVAGSEPQITNAWAATVDYRARSVDANSVTSDWSAAATLTVMPSAISATLAFNPSNVVRGVSSVLTAAATNGTAPYTYQYEYRYGGTGSWSAVPGMTAAEKTNAWRTNVEFRVRAVDSFSATSAWAAALLTVRYPSVTVAFNPMVVTQSQFSVVSASVTNATDPVTYQWQQNTGGGWTDVAEITPQITNAWAATVDYRARIVDANSVTSDWSAAATLTVMPSAISATLAFSPTNMLRGSNSVLTATATNGTAPYAYIYEYRYGPGGWTMATGMTETVTTNAWPLSVEYRVCAVDSFSSTSDWAAATLTVRQPAVTVAFNPTVVTQSRFSVVSASVTNATAPVTYEWQQNAGSGWTNVAETARQITNAWAATVDYRARSVDANSVTSEWSAAATLTVMPSAISATLAFSPTNMIRGSNSVLTATATNGTAPYAYMYEYRSGTGSWSVAEGMSESVTTNAWTSNVEYRVQAVDNFSSTSAWATASLTVRQPVMTVAFNPTVVTQSRFSVVSASVTNATAPVTYEWQQNTGSGWTNVAETARQITNAWAATVDYRARSVDANSVTSDWSAAATLTVMPSAISATLAFSPTNMIRGSNSVLTAVATNGTAPYAYMYEFRYGGTAGTWSVAEGMSERVTTNAWPTNVEYRVQAVDNFSSTSAWATASLTVRQPVMTVAFNPTVVTQSRFSVASASVTNATAPVTYEWQQNPGSGWTNVAETARQITNAWAATVDYRARSVDANSVTSDWSAAATLTVMPSAISATLAFSPTNMIRGSNSVLTATATNGTAPYVYMYEFRYGGTAGTWSVAEGISERVTTNAWGTNVEYRVQAVDNFSSTSAWASASLTVRQPAVTVAFNPTVVTQSRFSVVSASVTNATAPVTYEWQQNAGSGWTNVAETARQITNAWAATVDYRARSVDANSVTSDWSAAATLTVMPSAISATLAFNPTNVARGVASVMTVAPTNGTAPYVYKYEYRYGTGAWRWTTGMTAAVVTTNAWSSNVEYRVQAVDSFSSTSAWASASLTVRQPMMTVSFSPTVVTQSRFSVVSAVVSNATAPVTYEWQQNQGSGWTNVVQTTPQITNAWAATVDYRARSVDANSVTSDWSAAATLTVMPSAISATLAFSPTNMLRGSNSVLTATATNGTAPYAYMYEFRYGGTAGTWSVAEGMSARVTTNAWSSNVEYRVQAVDNFSSTSAWATASLTVRQPLVTVAFNPTVVTQSRFSVASASVTNATAPVTYEWQQNPGSGWTNVAETTRQITNAWAATVDYRARSVDANSVTSDWSAAATLTVMPSAISATLAFNPTNVLRGSNSVLTATATNGTAPYAYLYEYRSGTGSWSVAEGMSARVTTNAWGTNVEYRVQAVDNFSSTSAWASASLTVRQPTVTVAFNPTVVTQSRFSVASASVTNATLPVTYEWQQNPGSGWTNVAESAPQITNAWAATVDYRARSVDANSVTSAWSAAATLTVMPSAISATLAFNPVSVMRGSNSVLTAVATNGTEPYAYNYEYRYGTSNWSVAEGLSSRVTTNAWPSNVEYRVQAVDSFSSTSAWASASLTVRQPVVTVSFDPSSVPQSQSSVVSASVTNATLPVTYEWQQNQGSGWTNAVETADAITNVWAATVDYRARSVDANSVTSAWSAAATLTVLPSAISASLAFDPSNVVKGLSSVLTAVPTNGTAPYAYSYEYRYGGTGSWSAVPGMTDAVKTNVWRTNVEFRVKAVDSFSATSAWASAFLTVLQPAVTVAFSPAVVTQSQFSVASASVTNATAPVTYEWQQNQGSGWTSVSGSVEAITNAWAATVDYRARIVDANSVTSDWSAAATLTVLPSAISASLAFDPTNVVRGSNSVMTAVATNGTAPYAYSYEYRYGTGTWSAAAGLTAAVTTNAWRSNVEFRVRAVDSFSSTSAWAAASLTVWQPGVTVAFDPTQVVHGVSSVLSATVSNALSPYTLQFQTRATGEVAWSASPIVADVTTNEWLSSVEYRARVVNAIGVTSEWSAVATLTVLDPSLSVSLALNTNQVEFGTAVVLTASPLDGIGPYVYEYQSKDITEPGNDWVTEPGLSNAVETGYWFNSVDIRVRARDLDTMNLSYWSTSVTLVVLAPADDLAAPLITGLGIGSGSASLGGKSGSADYENITLNWNGSVGMVYSIFLAESLAGEWQAHPDAQGIEGYDGPMSKTIQVGKNAPLMFFQIRERYRMPKQ